MKLSRTTGRVLGMLAVLATLAAPLTAQQATGAVRGSVVDSASQQR